MSITGGGSDTSKPSIASAPMLYSSFKGHFTETKIAVQPIVHTEYKVLRLPTNLPAFTKDVASYFVSSWMKNAYRDMMAVWQGWESAADDDKELFYQYLAPALLTEKGELIDDPSKGIGRTGPIATYCETLLRAIRGHFSSDQVMIYPPVPAPPKEGNVDLVEIQGKQGDYASFRVVLWESKGSDGQAHGHNGKIYHQITDYPRRLFPISNLIGEYYRGDDPAAKLFLRDMAKLARNRSNQVHFGAFIVHDEKVPQEQSLVPSLNKYPPNHPAQSVGGCHHLVVLLIPDFKNARMEVWRALKFDPKP